MLTKKPYIGMLGHTDEDRPFMELNVDNDGAKKTARDKDLSEYLLIPRHKGYNHRDYKRTAPGAYEWTYCRVAVFCHLLHTTHRWVPREEDLKAGRLFGHNPLDTEPECDERK